jgi:hypothetical protein
VRAEDDLRLAWWTRRTGRYGDGIGLMTLAVAGAGADVAWARRGFRWLAARVAGHPFAGSETLNQALDDLRVLHVLVRLRRRYPPAKVSWHLLRADAIRGPYLGRRESIVEIVEDLWPVDRSRPRRPAGRIEPAPRLGVTRPVYAGAAGARA